MGDTLNLEVFRERVELPNLKGMVVDPTGSGCYLITRSSDKSREIQ